MNKKRAPAEADPKEEAPHNLGGAQGFRSLERWTWSRD